MSIHRNYDLNFFKTWSSDMAYILGFMYADGNIVETKRGNQYVAIYTADEELLHRMRTSMRSEHKIAKRESDTGCNYRIQIGSREWFADLGTLGLFPNKTKRMQLPDIPARYFGDFVRGYFDGDGNVWIGMINKYRNKPTRVIQVGFTSGSRGFLSELCVSLKKRGMRGGSLYDSKTKNFSRLSFSTIDALKLSEIMYNGQPKLYLRRKQLRFEQFRASRIKQNAGVV